MNQIDRSKRNENILTGIILGGIFVLFLMFVIDEPSTCTEEAVVLDIVSVDYRSATVFTNKGTFDLNQSYVKDGSTICIDYKEKR